MHTFSPMDSEADWRLSFPYQIIFQSVRTKLNPTVRSRHVFFFVLLISESCFD